MIVPPMVALSTQKPRPVDRRIGDVPEGDVHGLPGVGGEVEGEVLLVRDRRRSHLAR